MKPQLQAVVEALRSCFDPPEGFRFQGQTFSERCEAWAQHALDQLEEELEHTFRNFYHCPRCEHEWDDEWDCACDDQCPVCGLKGISPYRSEDA